MIEATGGGVLYEPGDVKALADAVEGLFADPENLRALGEAGRKAVWKAFSAERMAENIVRVCQEFPSKRTAFNETTGGFQIANRQSPI